MARAGVGFAISAAAGRTHGGRKTRAAGGSRDRSVQAKGNALSGFWGARWGEVG